MDISQEYIDMCQKATFLEHHHLWIRGDYYAEKILDRWYVDVFTGNEHYLITADGHPFIDWVWLPKQDQLQSMIDFETVSRDSIHQLAEHFKLDDYVTWEQLWLEFVMSEKFTKHWNGTAWEVGK